MQVSLDEDDLSKRGQGSLANGYKLVAEYVQGDWKWTKEAFHLNAYDRDSCCHLCNANKKD